jgi:hypothetical protein
MKAHRDARLSEDQMLGGVSALAATGYLHANYAHSLAEFGNPLSLPRSGGWILEREIPGTGDRDAMGCYPLFACRDWAGLRSDLDDLGEAFVSVCAVADPFGVDDSAQLRECFPDLVQPFKQHLIVDLTRTMRSFVSPHHRSRATKALRHLTIQQCPEPGQFLEEWTSLYQRLVERRGIRGIPRFSHLAFARQFDVPGLVMLRAEYRSEVVGIALWFVQGKVAYYHLSACSELGYSLGASYGLFWHSFECLQGCGSVVLDLGGSAGLKDTSDGLHRFKRGWATDRRPAFLCGRIFDRARYESLAAAAGWTGSAYFPAYREGEFDGALTTGGAHPALLVAATNKQGQSSERSPR